MKILVTSNGKQTYFMLNNNQASRDLFEQLPLKTNIADHNNNQKIFYPTYKLSSVDLPLASAFAGTLGYYAPSGCVVMFYHFFGATDEIYQLGYAISGSQNVQGMSGEIRIVKCKEDQKTF